MSRRWLTLFALMILGGVAVFALVREKREATHPGQVTTDGEVVTPPLIPLRPNRNSRWHIAPLPNSAGDVVVLIDHGQISRQDSRGQKRWSKVLEGDTGGVRPPHLLADTKRVYLAHEDGVSALDSATGAIVWRSPGPSDRMFLSGELLLAAGHENVGWLTKSWRSVTARNITTGKEIFRMPLPKDFDPNPIQDAAGLFLVQKTDDPSGTGLAILFDRIGTVHHQFGRAVVAARSWGGSRLFLTGHGVVRLSAGGVVEWTTPFREYEWLAGGGIEEIPGGGVVVYVYGEISDSGVRVLRVEPDQGEKVWEVLSDGLGVAHSAYSHTATVQVGRDFVRVESRGSQGGFIEILDLTSGRRLSREMKKP